MAKARFDENRFLEVEFEREGKTEWVKQECWRNNSIDAEFMKPCGFHCPMCHRGVEAQLGTPDGQGHRQVTGTRAAVMLTCQLVGTERQPISFEWPQGESKIIKPKIEVQGVTN